MTERRKGDTSTRRRKPSRLDEREMLVEEPGSLDEDEILDADEPEEADQAEPQADDRERPGRRSRPVMTASEAAKVALQQIATLTTKQPGGVTGIEQTQDGWTVGIELIEDQRIPSSADILATYETTIDADGELVSYRRVRRYARGRGDTEES